ncbi:16S rRNA (guanine(527)-N(7))-methyltransferase RsmG [Bavariicoccus seileri]|uniref:16S rRNA (guanine(527)-N(7))-methyltransferase RsmG n=1 Tax=Bavariicoccus seileri TaxID=549685 RepID=UPI0003B42FF6|nr:16S rRNA (guanine(527)-N(7))-methyltransferase RsmG [Bavariicoccus seileri]
MDELQFTEMIAQNWQIDLTDKQLEQFDRYYDLLTTWNGKINLTAITDQSEVYEKHFYDSLSLTAVMDLSQVSTIMDVGAGAGFPSIPLKIVFPHLKVTIVDSLNKRITFLKELSDDLGLEDVTLIHQRAEDAGQDPLLRERFDLVTARAVARLNVLAELCLPFARVSGHFAALKGAKAQEEELMAQKAITVLGGKVVKSVSLTLPSDHSDRDIILIEKVKKTPRKYPRQAGKPNRNPIV